MLRVAGAAPGARRSADANHARIDRNRQGGKTKAWCRLPMRHENHGVPMMSRFHDAGPNASQPWFTRAPTAVLAAHHATCVPTPMMDAAAPSLIGHHAGMLPRFSATKKVQLRLN